jgi:hypothetical protein
MTAETLLFLLVSAMLCGVVLGFHLERWIEREAR